MTHQIASVVTGQNSKSVVVVAEEAQVWRNNETGHEIFVNYVLTEEPGLRVAAVCTTMTGPGKGLTQRKKLNKNGSIHRCTYLRDFDKPREQVVNPAADQPDTIPVKIVDMPSTGKHLDIPVLDDPAPARTLTETERMQLKAWGETQALRIQQKSDHVAALKALKVRPAFWAMIERACEAVTMLPAYRAAQQVITEVEIRRRVLSVPGSFHHLVRKMSASASYGF